MPVFGATRLHPSAPSKGDYQGSLHQEFLAFFLRCFPFVYAFDSTSLNG
jgi:hypothetical protein